MPDNRNSSPCFGGRDTVYIDTNRILDSCRDKDCFEDVPVYLTDVGNEIVDRSSNARGCFRITFGRPCSFQQRLLPYQHENIC